MYEFELYVDAAGEARWTLRHPNNEIIGDSGEGYKDAGDMETTLRNFLRAAEEGNVRIVKRG